VRFDAAFSPTPHTSYAVTSMMTGKYMRPLLALGLGQDSDTWAGLLRKYGYRTAAFYPPAVFFIDEALFGSFRDRGLDFEYRKVEFATAELRAKQTNDYLGGVRPDQPLFLWLHLFEPHEPYVQHPEHPFGERPIDVYDSEIASADDAIGSVVDRVRAFRPHVTIIVTADHGEEFGEHGGRYHGTSLVSSRRPSKRSISCPPCFRRCGSHVRHASADATSVPSSRRRKRRTSRMATRSPKRKITP